MKDKKENDMKIGIMTFHFAYNYGAMLQAYALKEFLKKEGFSAEIIGYCPDELKHLYSANPLISNGKREFINKTIKYIRVKKKYKLFNDFIENFLGVKQQIYKDDLVSLNNVYNVFITGSDQVWNNRILQENGMYFLDYVDKDKIKISFAASFGDTEINHKFYDEIEKIKEFNWITVREQNGKELLNENRINADVILDPVFLLDKKSWIKIENRVPIGKKYILIYTLSYEKKVYDELTKIEDLYDYNIYAIHPIGEHYYKGRTFKYLENIGPREFIFLIRNAEIIITNSYHATVFGMMFQRNIINISNEKRRIRIDSLLNELSMESNERITIVKDEIDINKFKKLIDENKRLIKEKIKRILN